MTPPPLTAPELRRLGHFLTFSVVARAAFRSGTDIATVIAVGKEFGLTRQGLARALKSAEYVRRPLNPPAR
jgi:hypothetical protein